MFSNYLKNLNDDDLQKCLQGEGTLSCIRIITRNWEIIKEILNENGINNIKAFMNIIFDKISKLMKGVGDMETIEKRDEFENKIKNYILAILNDKQSYQNKETLYNQYNEKIKGTNPQSLVEILLENYSPFEGIYSQEIYPNLEMFLISKSPNIKNMKKCLKMKNNYENKYYLLTQVLFFYEENELIENVLNINKLVNLLYNKFNNKIERNEALKNKLSYYFKESKKNDKIIIENVINPYIVSWDKIKSKCTKYLCREEMPVLQNISIDSKLNYFLPDDGEIGGGMYLASAYRNFIDWQNNFISNIIRNGQNTKLNIYFSQLNQEIYINDANEEDIIKINRNILKQVKDMINKYSMRNIFKNGKIDYKEFNTINYDFDSIEEELAKIILPGIKKFVTREEDEPIRFFTFLYEAFRSNRSSIITNFNKKYASRDLSKEQQKLNVKLYKFIKIKKPNLKNILSSLQILIDYIQKENLGKDEQISNVIKNLPEYINIDEKLKMFFIQQNSIIFKISNLINIYDFFEIKCWDSFKDNICDQYKMHINDEEKVKLKCYIESTLTKNNLIQKEDLSNAVRRLISRYLVGKRYDVDINENMKLSYQIKRADLWRFELQNDINQNLFESEINSIFEGIKKNNINIVVKCGKEVNK